MLFPSFEEFYAHVGPRPSEDYSIERMNNDGHYEPGNVKWATRSEQQKNKRPFTTIKRHGKGYYFHKASGKYMVRIRWFGKHIYLGLFDTEAKAAAAHNERLTALMKELDG
jgi:hypothetical protein